MPGIPGNAGLCMGCFTDLSICCECPAGFLCRSIPTDKVAGLTSKVDGLLDLPVKVNEIQRVITQKEYYFKKMCGDSGRPK
ncbi:hypothetical protein J6590_075854 [Homalodisca vitripennis]|nr:hypothetical protein J6590_075854 [Homalodisca vitripennis]